MREALVISERRACRVLGQVRRTQRYTLKVADDETVLTANIISLASHYGRYGYRRITAMLRSDGWGVNHKRVVQRLRVFLDTPMTDSWSERRVRHEQAERGAIG